MYKHRTLVTIALILTAICTLSHVAQAQQNAGQLEVGAVVYNELQSDGAHTNTIGVLLLDSNRFLFRDPPPSDPEIRVESIKVGETSFSPSSESASQRKAKNFGRDWLETTSPEGFQISSKMKITFETFLITSKDGEKKAEKKKKKKAACKCRNCEPGDVVRLYKELSMVKCEVLSMTAFLNRG